MKRVRSLDTVRVRRELAQLLRRLRAIRRMKLSTDDMAEQMGEALSEAGALSDLISLRSSSAAGPERSDGCPCIDKRKLRQAELADAQVGLGTTQHAAIG
jgi:hypothetical protein